MPEAVAVVTRPEPASDPTVALTPPRLAVPPEFTVRALEVAPNAPPVVRASTPPLTTVPPVCELAPESVSVPLPSLTRATSPGLLLMIVPA